VDDVSVLRDVQRSDAFVRVRDFEAAARFHVWHSRLGLTEEVDRKAQEALAARRGFVVAGPSGSGKTSTLAAAALGTDGYERSYLAVKLSISGGVEVTDRANDPRFLAARLVRAIAQLSSDAERLVDAAAPSGTASGAVKTWRAQLGGRAARLGREVRQRTESVHFERTPDEVLDVASTALALLQDAGLRPVLLLEDADGLLRLPGKTPEERHEIANAFFADGLDPLLRHISIPALVAAQPEYLGLEGFKRVCAHFDAVCPAPAPHQLSREGLVLLIGETLRTSTANRSINQVFHGDALSLLVHNRYSLDTIRDVIVICSDSVLKARDEGRDQVLEEDVGYALSQR
jgi:hypothetical protein